jgi:hypothetical protein
MESFDDIRNQHIKNITDELATLDRQLIELGWSREQTLAFMTHHLDDPTNPATSEEEPDR